MLKLRQPLPISTANVQPSAPLPPGPTTCIHCSPEGYLHCWRDSCSWPASADLELGPVKVKIGSYTRNFDGSLSGWAYNLTTASRQWLGLPLVLPPPPPPPVTGAKGLNSSRLLPTPLERPTFGPRSGSWRNGRLKLPRRRGRRRRRPPRRRNVRLCEMQHTWCVWSSVLPLLLDNFAGVMLQDSHFPSRGG
jgi:hypothetical protein